MISKQISRCCFCFPRQEATTNVRTDFRMCFQDPAVAIAFDENGEVAPVPIDDPLMDELFPLAEACMADLGPDVTLLR